MKKKKKASYSDTPPPKSAVVQEEMAAAPDVGIFAAKTHLSALLEQVALGKSFFITKHGKKVAEVKPVASTLKKQALGWAKGKIWMAPDFDAPLDDFKEYM